MLHHVVLVTLRDGVTDEEVDGLLAGFASLPATIQQIRSYDVGREAGISPNDFDVVLVASFDSAEDFAAYRAHPVHQEFVRDVLTPVSHDRTSTQFFT